MNDKVSVQLGTTSDMENVEVPWELQSDLDGPHWTNFLDATTDLYWGLNLDNFHWGEHNGVLNANLEYIYSAILDYVNAELSWVLGATYKMDKPTSSILHASKATPQCAFH